MTDRGFAAFFGVPLVLAVAAVPGAAQEPVEFPQQAPGNSLAIAAQSLDLVDQLGGANYAVAVQGSMPTLAWDRAWLYWTSPTLPIPPLWARAGLCPNLWKTWL
jgi:hypothetical protein